MSLLRATDDQGSPDPVPHGAVSSETEYESEPIPPWPGHLVDLPGGQMFVRHAPAADGAQPAVFIHGLGGSSTNWTDLMDVLSRPLDSTQRARVLACSALDLPGFGYSPPPASGRYTISAHAAAVIELIEASGGVPTHLIANSMGGAVSTRVAATRPDLVRTLTLISPALPDLRPRLLPMRLALATIPGVGLAMLDWFQRYPAEARTDRALRDVYSDPAAVHPSRRREEIAEVTRRDGLLYANHALVQSARSLVNEYFKVGRRSLWRDAGKVSAPALILHGSNDRLVNPVMAGKAARAFSTARVMILPGVGHVAMMERPAVVASEIRGFYDWADSDRVGADTAPSQG
jgi:pimeloyl-ACP methyl ester carboxylesterase